MENTSYPTPLDTLLTLGTAEDVPVEEWPGYLASGINSEHIPDLVRMSKDHTLRHKFLDTNAYPDFTSDEHPEFWAPLHALRALGQLHATSASEELLPLFDESIKDDDDWILEELPVVYGLLGTSAIPVLAAYISEQNHDTYARGYAIEALNRIATQHPAAHDEVGKALTNQLEQFEENGDELNASLIESLVRLHYIEAVPLIERAFSANKVDPSYIGDWDEVQVQLGLQTTQQLDEKRRKEWEEEVAEREKGYATTAPVSNPYATPTRPHKQGSKKKARAKMAKVSRKKNQRKK